MQDNKNFLRDYNAAKIAALAELQGRIATLTPTEAGRRAGKKAHYMSAVKNGRIYISFKTILDLLEVLK